MDEESAIQYLTALQQQRQQMQQMLPFVSVPGRPLSPSLGARAASNISEGALPLALAGAMGHPSVRNMAGGFVAPADMMAQMRQAQAPSETEHSTAASASSASSQNASASSDADGTNASYDDDQSPNDHRPNDLFGTQMSQSLTQTLGDSDSSEEARQDGGQSSTAPRVHDLEIHLYHPDGEDAESDEYRSLKDLQLDVETHIDKMEAEQQAMFLPYLIASATHIGGHTDIGFSQERIEELIKKKKLSKVQLRVQKKHLAAEVDRLYEVIKQKEEDLPDEEKTKQPKYSNWKESRLRKWLNDHSNHVYPEEKTFLRKKLLKFFLALEQDATREEQEKRLQGGFLRNDTKTNMRIIMALCSDEFREAFLCMFDSLDVHGLDARNSELGRRDIYDLVTERVNQHAWTPDSIPFPGYHQEFAVSVPLPRTFEVDYTKEKIKEIIRDIMSRFKKSIEDWKRSGNGQDNLATTGDDALTIRFAEVEYLEEVDDDTEIKYVADDRHQFCKRLDVGFFWCVVDFLNLTTHANQKANKCGLSMDRAIASTNSRKRKKTAQDDHRAMMTEMTQTVVGSIERAAAQTNAIVLSSQLSDASQRVTEL